MIVRAATGTIPLILWAALSMEAAEAYRNAAPDVPYASSQACAASHADIYNEYTRSNMGRSMSRAGRELAAALPKPVELAHPRWNRCFRVYLETDSVFQSFAELSAGGKDLFRASFRLEFVVGSGVNGWSCLVRRDGHLFEAPLSYYSRAARWDLSPGYESVDVGFNRAILPPCIGCHVGRPNAGWNDQGRYADPPFAELAIGCENCHGPARSTSSKTRWQSSSVDKGRWRVGAVEHRR